MADWANIINGLWLSKIPTIFICKWELNKAVSVLTFEMLCQMTSVRSGGYSHWYYLHVSLLASLVWSFFTAGFLCCLLQAKKCPLCTSLLLHLNSTFSVFLIQMWFKHLIVCKSISFNFFVCTLAVPASQEKNFLFQEWWENFLLQGQLSVLTSFSIRSTPMLPQ